MVRRNISNRGDPDRSWRVAGIRLSAADRTRLSIVLFSRRAAGDRRCIRPGNRCWSRNNLSLRASGTVTAAGLVKCLAVDAASLHQLIENREIGLCFTSLLVEGRRRSEELTDRIARLEAPERVAAMLVDLYDRFGAVD